MSPRLQALTPTWPDPKALRPSPGSCFSSWGPSTPDHLAGRRRGSECWATSRGPQGCGVGAAVLRPCTLWVDKVQSPRPVPRGSRTWGPSGMAAAARALTWVAHSAVQTLAQAVEVGRVGPGLTGNTQRASQLPTGLLHPVTCAQRGCVTRAWGGPCGRSPSLLPGSPQQAGHPPDTERHLSCPPHCTRVSCLSPGSQLWRGAGGSGNVLVHGGLTVPHAGPGPQLLAINGPAGSPGHIPVHCSCEGLGRKSQSWVGGAQPSPVCAPAPRGVQMAPGGGA